MQAVHEAEQDGWLNVTERFKDLQPKLEGFEHSHLSQRGVYSVKDALEKSLPLDLLYCMWKDVSYVMQAEFEVARTADTRYKRKPLTFAEHLTSIAVAFLVPIPHKTLKARWDYCNKLNPANLVSYSRWSIWRARVSPPLSLLLLSPHYSSSTKFLSEVSTFQC